LLLSQYLYSIYVEPNVMVTWLSVILLHISKVPGSIIDLEVGYPEIAASFQYTGSRWQYTTLDLTISISLQILATK